MSTATDLYAERGGDRENATLILLHGLGATSAVWKPMIRLVEKNWEGRWIAPDLRGHGRSPFQRPYDFAAHASDVAQLIAAEAVGPVYLVGHSFGGAVGSLVSGGQFGAQVAGLFAFGVKLHWTADEIAKMRAISSKPQREFENPEEAVQRFLKGAGLFGLMDPSSQDAMAAVVGSGGRFRVRVDPHVFEVAGSDVGTLFRAIDCPLRMAAGEKDPMVTLEQMRQFDSEARLLAGGGHNIHFENPDAVWSEISKFFATVRAPREGGL